MSKFYTNVKVWGNNILYRGYAEEKQLNLKVPYKPTLFLPTNEETSFKTLYGQSLYNKKFDSIKDAKNFIKTYESVENFKIYGNSKFEYCLISDQFKDKVEWDFKRLKIGIFDIEVDSNPNLGGFALPENPFQPITSIAFKFLGEKKTYLFGCYNFTAPDGIIYTQCKDEWTLLKKFIEFWSSNYPDIISGWNIAFDISYIFNRGKNIVGEELIKNLSPWKIVLDKTNKKYNPKFNRYEDEFTYTLLGITDLDYMNLYKKYQPGGASKESYNLDFICSEEIGERKVEYEGSLHKLYSTDTQKFGEYNIQDVQLIENLDNKCRLFELALTLAYDSKCNIEDVYHQTRLSDTLFYNELKSQNTFAPIKGSNEFIPYEGGFVKPTITGLFKWIATIDASSLYPSVLTSWNISPETLVDKNDFTPEMLEILNNEISVSSLLERNINLDKLKEINVALAPNRQFFRTNIRGFVPKIIERLFNERKVYKAKMLEYQKEFESCVDNEEKIKLNGLIARFRALEQSKKLVANSIYGAFGNEHFRFYDVRIAEAITLCGQLTNRWIMKNVNEYLNQLLKSDKDYVLAADSVTGYTPICISYMKDDVRIIDVIPIDTLAKRYGNDNWLSDGRGKEFCELSGIDSWSDKGWTKLHRVIRHELLPHKKIVRILTHTGCVDVTDDHSLLLPNGEEISPKNVEIGMELLHNNVSIPEETCTVISEDEAKILGFFFGDGSCGKYKCNAGSKSSWALNNSSIELLREYKGLCEKVYPDLDWGILDTIKSSHVYKLVPKTRPGGTKIVDFVKKYRNRMYLDKAKIIPSEIFNSSLSVKEAFWDGLYAANGDKKGKWLRICQKNQISASHIYLLARQLGYMTSINSRVDKLNIFTIRLTKSFNKNPIKIKKLHNIDYSGYVYDLTTENNHFAAGVGSIIVHNTDSLMITLQDLIEQNVPAKLSQDKVIGLVSKIVDKKIQPKVDKFCKELLDYCNTYNQSISYKIEKICSSGVFVAKKRYALNVYSNEGVIYSTPKIKVTGLEIVKSSTPAPVRNVLKECVSIILTKTEKELQEEVAKFKKEFRTFDISKLAFPRGVNGISKYYDNDTIYKKGTPIHVRGALLYNNLLKKKNLENEFEFIKDGDKIKFSYLKLPNIIQENVIAFPEKLPKELDLNAFVDYNFMFEKTFYEPLKAVTDCIGWNLEERNTIF